MPGWIRAYVRLVERLNYGVGRMAMYLLFALMGVLIWSSLSKLGRPSLWTLEMAQFLMVAYYTLGGAYSMQIGGHVRMDLLYSRWSPRGRAWADGLTVFCLIFYLGVLLWGAVDSTIYSIQVGEVRGSAWRPYLWPVKLCMCIGILLMLLQATAFFFRDLATLRGEEL